MIHEVVKFEIQTKEFIILFPFMFLDHLDNIYILEFKC